MPIVYVPFQIHFNRLNSKGRTDSFTYAQPSIFVVDFDFFFLFFSPPSLSAVVLVNFSCAVLGVRWLCCAMQ